LRSLENTPAFEDEQKRARVTLQNEAYGIVVNDAGTRIDEPGYIAESGKFTIWRKDSFGWLVEKYLASIQQRNDLFKYTRETNLRAILREPVKPRSPRMFGEYHMRQIQVEHIETLRDRKAQAGMNSTANNVIKQRKYGFAINYASKQWADKVDVEGDGYETLTEQELEQYRGRHPIGTMARLAVELAWCTGQRVSDIALLGQKHIVNGYFEFMQFKNRGNKYRQHISLLILPELQKTIGATKTGDETFLVNRRGLPSREQVRLFFQRRQPW
jgi:integrase